MHYLLTWAGEHLVSVDLEDGQRCVLVFDDRADALEVGQVIAAERPRVPIQVIPLDARPAELRATLRPFIDTRLDLRGVRLLFAGEPLFRRVVQLVVQRARG